MAIMKQPKIGDKLYPVHNIKALGLHSRQVHIVVAVMIPTVCGERMRGEELAAEGGWWIKTDRLQASSHRDDWYMLSHFKYA